MRNYKVNFFKVEKKEDPKTREVIEVSYKSLGSLTIDDSNTSSDFPLAAKAYRSAGGAMQNADRLEFQEIKL